MKRKTAMIGMVLVMTLALGACGNKTAGTGNSSGGAAGENGTAGANITGSAAGENGTAGTNMTGSAAGENGTAGANIAGSAAGENGTAAAAGPGSITGGNDLVGGNAAGENGTAVQNAPVLLDPPSMKTAYKPETEDEKYARELTGVYLLTDLKDALYPESGEAASKLAADGEPMYLEFYYNGTMRETVFGDPMGGTWDKEYLTLGSDRVPYSVSGNKVTVTTDNMDLTFTRTTQEELDLLLSSGGSGQDEKEPDAETEDAGDDAAAGEDDAADTGNGESSAEETDGYAEGQEDTEGTDEYTEDWEDTEDTDGYTEEWEDAASAATLQNVTDPLIQEDLCSMTVTGYDFNDPRGFVVRVYCENYTVNRLAFNVSDAVVNNVMFRPGTEEKDYWTLEVEPLTNALGEIVFRADLAAEYGITSFDYILLSLWVRNMDDWMADPIYMGDKELYPTGKVTGEGLQSLTRRKGSAEQKIAEENKFIYTILESEQRENGDFVLKVCIENKTWQNLTFTWDDVYVNGILLDPFWACETLPGTISYWDIVFPADELQENNVKLASDVTFTMTVYDSRDWLAYSIYTKTSTYRV